jgi:glycylpeptide N-tetradecanoyltransferase
MLPVPIAQARYFHRALDPKKLVDVNFSSLPKTQNMKIHQRIYSLEEEVKLEGVRPMVEADVAKVRQLLVDYLS